MRVGLVRHFPVLEPLPRGWMTAGDLQTWRQRYDEAGVCPSEVADETPHWVRCYASDLSRAQWTARALWSGEVISLPDLREAEFAPFATGSLRLPVWTWRVLIRLAWMTGHASQRDWRDGFRDRVKRVADLIEADDGDILVVSHAGMMFFLSRELLRRGFRGPRLGMADHARLYVFERTPH